MLSGHTKFFGFLTVVAGLAATPLLPAQAHVWRTHTHRSHHHARLAYLGAQVIQCVAFAKQDAGIEISGNARDWWGNAAGMYQRGRRPESGSVLSFRANGRMPLGHVAVVSGIRDGRTITIDQSHWNSRGISRDIEVEDVSEDNDWSAVRVQLGHGGGFGSIYPTHGFIYPRPDRGSFQTSDEPTDISRRRLSLTTLAADSRQAGPATLELAELPATAGMTESSQHGLALDAPSRGLR